VRRLPLREADEPLTPDAPYGENLRRGIGGVGIAGALGFDTDPDCAVIIRVAPKETLMRCLIVAAFAAALSLVVNVSSAQAQGYGMHRHYGDHYGMRRHYGDRYGMRRHYGMHRHYGDHYGMRRHHLD